jgi:hypothetical protein
MPKMSSNNTPLDLAAKAAHAVAAYIKTSPEFRTVPVVPETTEDVKKAGTVVVSARRGEPVGGINSGVWSLSVTAEFNMRRRANGATDATFQKRVSAITVLFEQDFRSTAEKITSCFNGAFHCYDVRFESDDKTPQDGHHHYELNLTLEAMPVSYSTGLQNNKLIDKSH